MDLYWKILPDNTQATKAENKKHPERKISKAQIFNLLCKNADGSHMLKSMVENKHKKPQAIKIIIYIIYWFITETQNLWLDCYIVLLILC